MRAFAATIFFLIPVVSAAPPPNKGIAVSVQVRTHSGTPIGDAYVALVPEWRSSSHPLVEEIAKNGFSTFSIPPGTYRLLAGARGFALSSQEPVSVSGSSVKELSIELTPLKPVSGIVTDEAGTPIVGARVLRINLAIPPPLGPISEMAVRSLGSDWSDIADSKGKWTLGVPEGDVPLLFEASGRKAEWRIGRANADLSVSLSKGSKLDVTTDRADPNLVLTLSPDVTSAAVTSIPADKQPLLWARWATKSLLSWSSLPPGVYGIYAKYPDPLYFTQTATRLATVTLSPGEEHKVRLVLPPVKKMATSSIALFLSDLSRTDLGEGTETFGRDTKGKPLPVESFTEEVIGGSVVHMRTDESSPPFYGITEDRFFGSIPALADAKREVGIEPWPAAVQPRADVRIQLRAAETTMQIPQSGMVRLRDCQSGQGFAVPMEIRKTGFAGFAAPAGCKSLVVELEPFEPIILSKVLKPGDQFLGEFVLRASASADVHVVRDPSGSLVAGASVRVTASGDKSAENSIPLAEVVTDERGWAHISGLPSYRDLRVVAETREGDKSDAALLRLEPRGRGLIDPLGIPGPATLVVDAKIAESVLTRFPSAHLLSLILEPADPSRGSEKLQNDEPNKPVHFGPLHPGRWLLSAVVRVEGSWAMSNLEDLDLKAGETRALDEKITPNVFEGIVTSDGRGVAAKVLVDERGKTLSFDSDSAGMFLAVLQNPGIYPVGVARMSAQSNVSPVGDVAFTDPARRIEIAIPKGAVVVTRVHMGDRPLPKTVVWLSRRDSAGLVDSITNRGRATDLTGNATFEDLAPGSWTFSVRETESRSGAEKSITVDSGESKTLDLDLTEAPGIHGTIRDIGQSPLPGAHVDCLFVGPTGSPDRASAVSDSDGTFSIQLIAPVPPRALCSVVGPLGNVDGAKVVPGQDVYLTMPSATGTLRVVNLAKAGKLDIFWLVAPDGRGVSLSAMAINLGQFGSTLSIPALSSGPWKVVRIQSLAQWLTLANGLGATLQSVAEISLSPGATETVQLEAGN